MSDPDMGDWSYDYNVLGELVKQTDAKGQIVTMTYDVLGRMDSRTEAEGQTTWDYDTATKGKGKLHTVTGPAGYFNELSYGQGSEENHPLEPLVIGIRVITALKRLMSPVRLNQTNQWKLDAAYNCLYI